MGFFVLFYTTEAYAYMDGDNNNSSYREKKMQRFNIVSRLPALLTDIYLSSDFIQQKTETSARSSL